MSEYTPTNIPIGGARGVASVVRNEFQLVADAVVTKADLAGPALTGVPTAPTAAPGTDTTQVASTAFVAALGALKANIASPTLTGVPAAPTAAPGTDTTQIATTAFTAAAAALKADLVSPALTGTPTAPTAAPGTNTTQIATTAFTAAAAALKADLVSPALTGTPTAPTAAPGTSNTQIATTEFTAALAFSSALPAQAGNAGKVITTDGTVASWAATDSAAGLPSLVGNAEKSLMVNSDADGVEWGLPSITDYQEFTTTDTWTKPAGVNFVYVEVTDGGRGGSSGAARTTRSDTTTLSTSAGGGGGTGGATTRGRIFMASELPASGLVTIGAGGAGAARAQVVTLNWATLTANSTSGTLGGLSEFIDPNYFLSSEKIALASMVGGSINGSAGGNSTFNMNTNTYTALAGVNGLPIFGYSGALPTGGAFLLNTTVNADGTYTASNGENSAGSTGGAGGGAATCRITASNLTLIVEGGNGGNALNYGGGGGGGGGAAAVCRTTVDNTGSSITVRSGAGGNGGSGVVRIWAW